MVLAEVMRRQYPIDRPLPVEARSLRAAGELGPHLGPGVAAARSLEEIARVLQYSVSNREAASMVTSRRARKKPTARKGAKKAARRTKRKAVARRKRTKPARQARHQPESLRLRSAGPSLTVNDIERSLAWYRDVLGFTVEERWEHEGRLAGVELVAGRVFFWLSQDDWKKGRDRAKGEGFRLHCETAQDVDRLAERIRARGGRLLEEPRDRPWGTRDFGIADPDGFKITIAAEG
jgi:lactoylglutathione lyase